MWLAGFCILVLLMISVGGITRLTRSGLSIVEWRPITGIIPPLTEADWQSHFELYKQSPEYNHINSHFELSDYKNIFMWEYLHRVLGRIIFLFVIIPGAVLWRKKMVSGRLVLLLAGLVALQGLIGWLMVKTGLNVKPHVSPYMLALHFFSALSVLVIAYYQLQKMRPQLGAALTAGQQYRYVVFGVLLFFQIFYGCLTSGLKAGVGYNTYPLMNGQFFPDGGLFFYPAWLNFLENPATVQWTHRWLGIITLLSLVSVIASIVKTTMWAHVKKPFFHLLGLIFLQVFLGILNIIYVVPVSLAATHQFVAALIVISYFSILFRLPPAEKVF